MAMRAPTPFGPARGPRGRGGFYISTGPPRAVGTWLSSVGLGWGWERWGGVRPGVPRGTPTNGQRRLNLPCLCVCVRGGAQLTQFDLGSPQTGATPSPRDAQLSLSRAPCKRFIALPLRRACHCREAQVGSLGGAVARDLAIRDPGGADFGSSGIQTGARPPRSRLPEVHGHC